MLFKNKFGKISDIKFILVRLLKNNNYTFILKIFLIVTLAFIVNAILKNKKTKVKLEIIYNNKIELKGQYQQKIKEDSIDRQRLEQQKMIEQDDIDLRKHNNQNEKYLHEAKNIFEKQEYYSALIKLKNIKDLSLNSRGYFYWLRGACYAKTERYSNAIIDFTNSINIDSNDPDTYSWRASSYFELKNYGYAIFDYSKAISLSKGKEKAKFLNQRGVCSSYLDKSGMAKLDFKAAVELDPTNQTYIINLESINSSLTKKTDSNKINDASSFFYVTVTSRKANIYSRPIKRNRYKMGIKKSIGDILMVNTENYIFYSIYPYDNRYILISKVSKN